MTLKQYCQRERGTMTRVAFRLGVSVSVFSNWVNGRRRIPADMVLVIEHVTRGQVRAETLRPDLSWKRATPKKRSRHGIH